MLDDGTYDAIVVDAEVRSDGSASFDLTVVSGARKGEVVSVNAIGLDEDPIGMLGIPATLVVVDGEPDLTLEP